jgi:predicted RNA binding protein YcfA (HicA-like mRNA interferase family)
MTYEQFDTLLRRLGFTQERVESKWLRYRHEEAELVIVVAAKPASEFVRVSDAVSARRHLVEKGVVSAKKLDALLSQNSIPEASGKKA